MVPNKVEKNARGRPPTNQYKVSATYQDGYRAVATVSIVGPNAALKAERTAKALIARARMIFGEWAAGFSATHIEALGAEASYGAKSAARASREVLLRLVVEHADRGALEIFAREIGSIGLSCAPGTTGIYSGGRSPRQSCDCSLLSGQGSVRAPKDPDRRWPDDRGRCANSGRICPPTQTSIVPADPMPDEVTVELPLARLAYARSGDKGNSANIAIIARKPKYVPLLRRELTPERMSHILITWSGGRQSGSRLLA